MSRKDLYNFDLLFVDENHSQILNASRTLGKTKDELRTFVFELKRKFAPCEVIVYQSASRPREISIKVRLIGEWHEREDV